MIPDFLIPALAAYFFLALAGLIDKILLQTTIISPRAYAFWVGILSVLAVGLLPFGVVNVPDLRLVLTAFVSGATNVYALWAFYSALKEHEASRVIVSVGALVPLFTLVFSIIFLNEHLRLIQLLAFALLVFGGVLISYQENIKKPYTFELFHHAARAAILFAVSFTLLRFVFLFEPFFSGFFWTRIGSVLGALTIIAIPENLQRIYWATKKAPKRAPLPFLANQAMGGGGAVLQNYAISLGSAALVGALQGFQYAFVLGLVVFLSRYFPQLKEEFSLRSIIQKSLAIILIGAGLIVLATR